MDWIKQTGRPTAEVNRVGNGITKTRRKFDACIRVEIAMLFDFRANSANVRRKPSRRHHASMKIAVGALCLTKRNLNVDAQSRSHERNFSTPSGAGFRIHASSVTVDGIGPLTTGPWKNAIKRRRSFLQELKRVESQRVTSKLKFRPPKEGLFPLVNRCLTKRIHTDFTRAAYLSSGTTFTQILLSRGPSNSQRKMPCQAPKASSPFSTKITWLAPTSTALAWESVFPSAWR